MLRHIIGDHKKTTPVSTLQNLTQTADLKYNAIPDSIHTEVFEHGDAEPYTNNTKNVIGSDVEVKGSIKFVNDLIMNGTIEGEIVSSGRLIVGKEGFVKGEVKSQNVIISGNVQGNVTAQESCILRENAVVVGDITAGSLSIEEGVTFQGQSRVGRKVAPNTSFNGRKTI